MTTQAENHLILIDAARAMHERHRHLHTMQSSRITPHNTTASPNRAA